MKSNEIVPEADNLEPINENDNDYDKKQDLNETCKLKFKRLFKLFCVKSNYLNSNSHINTFIVFFSITGLIWLIIFALNESYALPGGILYSLWILFTFSHIFAFLFSVIKLPGLLGMLLVGIGTANLSYIKVNSISLDSQISNIIRKMALCVILCRAGLGVNVNVLKNIKFQVFKLACIPCITEVVAFSIVNKFILDMPFEWSFLLGFAVSGVSPAIVVPFMLNFQEQGLGTDKGIPTLFIASASFDNIIAITGHSVMVGIIFNQGQLWWTIVKTPVQIIIGVIAGVILGLMLNLIRLSLMLHVSILRFLLLLLLASALLFGFQKISFPGVGPLGILCLAITAKVIWTKIDKNNPRLKDMDCVNKVSNIFNRLWVLIFEPLLFASIGNEIIFSKLDGKSIGFGILSLLVGILFRIIGTFFSSTCSNFNLKEKIFICIGGLPKATVQAAVGVIALDIAKEKGNENDIKLGTIVLTLSVVSILLTAPIGAMLITLTGPKLLSKENKSNNEVEMIPQV